MPRKKKSEIKNTKKRKKLSSSILSSSNVEWEKLHELDHVKEFSEIACVQGVLGRFPGDEVLPLIKRFRNFITD